LYGSCVIAPTEKQRRILDFIQDCVLIGKPMPTVREICREFGFRSPRSALDHLTALERKGLLKRCSRKARAIELTHVLPSGIPLLGSIPAGYPDDAAIHECETLPFPPQFFGISERRNAFALKVRGDSMEGRRLVDGDILILEHGASPADGDVVAALIDGESTLKTFVSKGTQAWLRAENPRYPDLLPIDRLEIQGVARGAIRGPNYV
jgi:repressor LexA